MKPRGQDEIFLDDCGARCVVLKFTRVSHISRYIFQGNKFLAPLIFGPPTHLCKIHMIQKITFEQVNKYRHQQKQLILEVFSINFMRNTEFMVAFLKFS